MNAYRIDWENGQIVMYDGRKYTFEYLNGRKINGILESEYGVFYDIPLFEKPSHPNQENQ